MKNRAHLSYKAPEIGEAAQPRREKKMKMQWAGGVLQRLWGEDPITTSERK